MKFLATSWRRFWSCNQRFGVERLTTWCLLAVRADVDKNRKLLSETLQSHHRMYLVRSISRQILSAVRLIFGSVANVEVCFADDSDDRRFVDREFSSRANVKRKARPRPTKNRFTN
jgi:hypothetical protein